MSDELSGRGCTSEKGCTSDNGEAKACVLWPNMLRMPSNSSAPPATPAAVASAERRKPPPAAAGAAPHGDAGAGGGAGDWPCGEPHGPGRGALPRKLPEVLLSRSAIRALACFSA